MKCAVLGFGGAAARELLKRLAELEPRPGLRPRIDDVILTHVRWCLRWCAPNVLRKRSLPALSLGVGCYHVSVRVATVSPSPR